MRWSRTSCASCPRPRAMRSSTSTSGATSPGTRRSTTRATGSPCRWRRRSRRPRSSASWRRSDPSDPGARHANETVASSSRNHHFTCSRRPLGTASVSDTVTEQLILTEREGPVAVVRLNRPQQLNALSDALMDELVRTLEELDRDDATRAIVLGGNERAFAAGADIGELAEASAIDLSYQRRVERWDAIRGLWTPLIAAVSGFCLGGGCELAMSCDLIVASETAQFGQPETSLGI